MALDIIQYNLSMLIGHVFKEGTLVGMDPIVTHRNQAHAPYQEQ